MNMTIDLTDLIVGLIGILATIITTVVIPYIKSKTTSEKFAQIQLWTNVGVQAAEQIFTGTGMGEKKKEYVIQFLADKGYNVDADKIDAVIESSVLELKKAIS